MRIAMAQINSSDDPTANLVVVADVAAQAAADGADLVVFPEATMCRFGVPLGPVAEPLDGPWATHVSQIAVERRITIIAGMFRPADDGRVFNTLLIAHPDGSTVPYDKIHLYDAFGFRESRTVAAGDKPVVVDVAGTVVGVATCYDIRFPDLFIALAEQGAQVIAVPASWGAGPGKVAQWEVLATARALDCSAYVVAVGQAEPDDPALREGSAPTGVGHSQITDPLGTVVAAYGSGKCVRAHDIDLTAVTTARERIAVLANRKSIRPVSAQNPTSRRSTTTD